MRRVLILLVINVLIGATASAQVPSFDHVFVIVMENKELGDVIGSPQAPFINALAASSGLGTDFTGVTHPSLPNYMALTSGVTAFTNDCIDCRSDALNIVDRLEASGRTWRAYMQDMPAGSCGTYDSGLYVARHNPFTHYSDIVNNAARCANMVPLSQFNADLYANAMPSFSWISPNLCYDMHDCSIATGDDWLSAVVPRILQSPAFANGVLFLVWDEGTTAVGGGGRIPMIVTSRWTAPGLRSGANENHYNLLRTIEDAWGLAPLGQSASATPMIEYFTTTSSAPATQVIYASDVTTMKGTWTTAADPTAAGGVKLITPDFGVGAIGSPSAAPANYFDATFAAEPGVRYRTWFRIHPSGDSKWNDSFFVQFSDSVDGNGNPIYRLGTGSGYAVNLWTCSDCQTHGWGWQRNAYWLPDSGDVWFANGGSHTVRVQIREDGAEIDQIVISPSTYVNASPGLASDDTTIVAKAGSPPPPSPAPTPTPTASHPEIVVYAVDLAAESVHGAWTRVADASSPGGVRLFVPDNGWASTVAPLAAPADYVDITFAADANTPYTLWLRMKALNNNKYNDSIWVQFSDAQASGGQTNPIGSTSALLANLATDANATSLDDWGWQNGAYWLSQPVTVTFPSAGNHTLRIQTREDGVSVDQVVLSSKRYLSTPPGSISHDTTIVSKP
jgi:hypothetical protein